MLGTETWLAATAYYDGKCRPIQTVSDNQHGGLSTVNTVYDFVGNVLKQRETHSVSAAVARSGEESLEASETQTSDSAGEVSADTVKVNVLETVNTYDDRNRLLTATSTLNHGTPATVNYEYDEIGCLVKKHYGNDITEEMAYNIRGWLPWRRV